MKLILIGPQGSGKGTQADLISNKYKIPHISAGNILLDNIKLNTKLGKLAKPYYNKGKLVPIGIVSDLIKNRIKKKDCDKGFILDGYPRTLEQANLLEKITKIDKVLVLTLPREKVYERISKRYMCECGANYHVIYKPSKIKGVCDKCGGKLFRREDDTIPVIKKRLDIYEKETKPLIEHYGDKVIKINGDQPIPKVFEDMVGVLS
ncbi:MAG: nucleoside monophosphate kinase [Nanoarchaeota archaeon]|nr:nucleoside monophosphate kinase [Nanoarchaeota archaeon]